MPLLLDCRLCTAVSYPLSFRAERYHGDQDPPLYVAFRFFNITNVEEVRKGAKAVLVSSSSHLQARPRLPSLCHWLPLQIAPCTRLVPGVVLL